MTDIELPNPAPISSAYYGPGLLKVYVDSFGYLHEENRPTAVHLGGRPTAHITIDLRRALFDPHVDSSFRELTGLDPRVRTRVLNTDGATRLLSGAYETVQAMLPGHDARGLVVRVAFGCAGGRHRSVVMANELTRILIDDGIGAEVTHYDVQRPVVKRPAELPR